MSTARRFTLDPHAEEEHEEEQDPRRSPANAARDYEPRISDSAQLKALAISLSFCDVSNITYT